MQKKFLGNLLFIIFLNLIIKPFYIFGIDIQVQNIVGAEDYGLYFTLLNISLLFNMFLDIGISNYNTTKTAQRPAAIETYIGSYLGLKLLLIIPYVFVTIGFALITGYTDHEMYILSFFILNQVLAGFILYIRSNFAGLHLFKIDALLSILDRLLVILIIGAIIYGHVVEQSFKIEWFIYAQTFAYSFTLLTGIVLTRIKIGRVRFAVKRFFSMAILKRSAPFALLILLMMLYTRIDAIMVERLLPNGKEQSGIYAQVFRLLDAINMFAFLVAGILLPIFSRLIGENQSVKPILQTAGKLLTGVAIVVAIGLALNSELTISIIYKHNIILASQAFIWLILCFIPLSISHVFGTLLTANHSLRLLNKLAFLGILLNVALNYFLIPKMEAEGAAIATLITQSATALGQLILVMRIFKFSIHWSIVFRIGLLVVIYVLLAYFLHDNYGEIWSMILTFAGGVLLLFILKLLNLKDLFALLKTKVENKNDQ